MLLACRRASTLAAATHARAPRVDRSHALLCPRVGGVRACTLPLALARRSLQYTKFNSVTERALKAAARSGLELNGLGLDSSDDDD